MGFLTALNVADRRQKEGMNMEKGRRNQCMAMKTDKAYEYGSMAIKNNRPYEHIKGDAGSIIVEMCVLMPIVITIVFIAINMMFMQINRAAARGEAYAITYNKESCIAGQVGAGDEMLEQQIFQSLSECMNNLDELEISVAEDKESRKLFYSVRKRKTVVKYEENHLGIGLLIDKKVSQNKIKLEEEIRDTGNNLRRWQLYGKEL